MVLKRLIPVILLKDGGMVITHKFSKHKYVGDPINAVKIFNDKEADEIVVLDITASKENKNPNYELISRIAQEAFMPLSYGGGIKKLDQIQNILYMGYEKVVLNNILFVDFNILTESVKRFGSSSIAVGIDIKKDLFGKHKLYNHVTNKLDTIDLNDYLTKVLNQKPGEIILNYYDRDGQRTGYDIDHIDKLSKKINVSTVCMGGAGEYSHFSEVFTKSSIDGLAAGSIFALYGKHRAVLITYDREKISDYMEKYDY